jgi:hypothetical protein
VIVLIEHGRSQPPSFMGSPRTLRRRRQRIAAKSRPRPSGPKWPVPQWLIDDIVKQFNNELVLMKHIARKY